MRRRQIIPKRSLSGVLLRKPLPRLAEIATER